MVLFHIPYSLFLTRKGVANDKYVSFLISCLTRNDEYSNVSMPIPSSLFDRIVSNLYLPRLKKMEQNNGSIPYSLFLIPY